MIAKVLIFGIVILSIPNVVIKGDINMVDESHRVNEPIIVYISGTINERSARTFADDMRMAHETGQPVIPIVIRSYGGSVYSLLSIIDVIKSAKVPVATIVVGKAMSAGAALLTCGTDGMRYAAPHSTIMIHEVSNMIGGKVKEIKANAEETDRLNELILSIMSLNVGKKENYFSEIIHSHEHADWYLTPTEAMKHNVINHIGVPELEVNITVKTILKIM